MTSDPGSERPSDGERGGGQAPVDPGVDIPSRSDRIETRARRWDVLVAIAIGGVLGSEARHGISIALRHPADAMPWATFLINVSGCALIGVLMVHPPYPVRTPNATEPQLPQPNRHRAPVTLKLDRKSVV